MFLIKLFFVYRSGIPPEERDLLATLCRFQWEGFLCDATLVSDEGMEILAHAAVLAAASPFIEQQLSKSGRGQYYIRTRVSEATLMTFIQLAYTGRQPTDDSEDDTPDDIKQLCGMFTHGQECHSIISISAPPSSISTNPSRLKQELGNDTSMNVHSSQGTVSDDGDNKSGDDESVASTSLQVFNALQQVNSSVQGSVSSPVGSQYPSWVKDQDKYSNVSLKLYSEAISRLGSSPQEYTPDPERPYPCHWCGKAFGRPAHLKEHLRCHTGERPYKCDLCGNSFRKHGSLKHHLLVHTGEKPFTCFKCGKGFSQAGDLKRHKRTHTGEKPYACRYCQKEFGRLESLKRHERVHTGEKPFTCELCAKPFRYQGDLKRHELTHTGEKPHTCKTCGKSFSQMGNLRQHERMHAGLKVRAGPSNRELKERAMKAREEELVAMGATEGIWGELKTKETEKENPPFPGELDKDEAMPSGTDIEKSEVVPLSKMVMTSHEWSDIADETGETKSQKSTNENTDTNTAPSDTHVQQNAESGTESKDREADPVCILRRHQAIFPRADPDPQRRPYYSLADNDNIKENSGDEMSNKLANFPGSSEKEVIKNHAVFPSCENSEVTSGKPSDLDKNQTDQHSSGAVFPGISDSVDFEKSSDELQKIVHREPSSSDAEKQRNKGAEDSDDKPAKGNTDNANMGQTATDLSQNFDRNKNPHRNENPLRNSTETIPAQSLEMSSMLPNIQNTEQSNAGVITGDGTFDDIRTSVMSGVENKDSLVEQAVLQAAGCAQATRDLTMAGRNSLQEFPWSESDKQTGLQSEPVTMVTDQAARYGWPETAHNEVDTSASTSLQQAANYLSAMHSAAAQASLPEEDMTVKHEKDSLTAANEGHKEDAVGMVRGQCQGYTWPGGVMMDIPKHTESSVVFPQSKLEWPHKAFPGGSTEQPAGMTGAGAEMSANYYWPGFSADLQKDRGGHFGIHPGYAEWYQRGLAASTELQRGLAASTELQRQQSELQKQMSLWSDRGHDMNTLIQAGMTGSDRTLGYQWPDRSSAPLEHGELRSPQSMAGFDRFSSRQYGEQLAGFSQYDMQRFSDRPVAAERFEARMNPAGQQLLDRYEGRPTDTQSGHTDRYEPRVISGVHSGIDRYSEQLPHGNEQKN